MPGGHAAGTVTVPTAFTEVDVSCTDGTSYTFAVPPPLAPTPNANGFYYSGSKSAASNPQTFAIPANDNLAYPSAVWSTPNPGCGNGAPGTITGTYFYGLGVTKPRRRQPRITWFPDDRWRAGIRTDGPARCDVHPKRQHHRPGWRVGAVDHLKPSEPVLVRSVGVPADPDHHLAGAKQRYRRHGVERHAVECNGNVHAD